MACIFEAVRDLREDLCLLFVVCCLMSFCLLFDDRYALRVARCVLRVACCVLIVDSCV